MRRRAYIAMIAIATALIIAAPVPGATRRLELKDVGAAIDGKHVEIRGVAAGPFDLAIWQNGKLHLLPDHRHPLLEPQAGTFRNIYAPSIVQKPDGGWRVYYGAWDGVETGNDRIYLVETPDFLSFGRRRTVIEHGVFEHVCNVNVTPWQGGYAMACTVYPDKQGRNKPATFFSEDGIGWNGATTEEPFSAGYEQIVQVDGYEKYADADVNGMNVLLRDGDRWRLYFSNFRDFGKVFVASGADGQRFKLDGVALKGSMMVNDVKTFRSRSGNRAWHLMALHANGEELFYSVSRNPKAFPAARSLAQRLGEEDRYVVAVGLVTDGAQDDPERRVLGFLYGAGAKPSLDANRIFARWLQKKVMVESADQTIAPVAGLGPDRQLLAVSDAGFVGRIRLLGEDGASTLAVSTEDVELKPGRAYQLEVVSDARQSQ